MINCAFRPSILVRLAWSNELKVIAGAFQILAVPGWQNSFLSLLLCSSRVVPQKTTLDSASLVSGVLKQLWSSLARSRLSGDI